MDSQTYFTLHIHNVAARWEDLLTSELFDIGAEGVQENLEFINTDKEFNAKAVEAEIKTLIAYFSTSPTHADIEKIQNRFPEVKLQFDQHPIEDWLAEWKKRWKAFPLVGDVWIVPSWEKERFSKEGLSPLYIDPGMAFGTGTHETTQIAAQLLLQLCQQESVTSMVDVGTGSGILALLGQKFGIRNIWAYDNDPECKRVFFENLELNESTPMIWETEWSQNLNGQLDLTVANIIDGVLIKLKPEFQKVKSPYYIFTGILEEREKEFLEEMLAQWPLKTIARLQKTEWVGFIFKAPE